MNKHIKYLKRMIRIIIKKLKKPYDSYVISRFLDGRPLLSKDHIIWNCSKFILYISLSLWIITIIWDCYNLL